ncbi:MAG TPA: Rne/Rng family ribonuclease [Microbacteriaceae bacterium]|nr:Rne/Rng family ribonuclease [Microbacteriaceae bacterium]
MVEKQDNTNIQGNDAEKSAETGAKRRTRLFGARRSAKKSQVTEAPAEQVIAPSPEVSSPDARSGAAPTVDAQRVDGPSAESEQVGAQPAEARTRSTRARAARDQSSGAGTTTTTIPEETAGAQADAQGEKAGKAAAVGGGRPAPSILFQAPDIKPLPPLPPSLRDDQGDESTTVRRRARRRPGEEARTGTDDPANTVVKVRTPREPELITEPQRVKGSTRLEAKKQRRRDGRDAGRRRPVVTEAEFLARRESVDRQMVVRSKDGRIQIGVLEDSVLVEHYVAKSQEASLIGNVYLGRVQNVLPSMEAAFVDIGRGRNAVLYSGEVDWEAAAENSTSGNQPRRIELALKAGDKVLVQVTKDPIGHKGARLTSQVSLPGRYLVYVPNGSMNGISRKLPDTERARLKKILKEVLPENVGVIVRTAAEGATEEQLTLDVNRLTAQWAEISKQVETVQAPALLHSEPDLLIKIVRDVFNEDFQKMVIAGGEAQSTIENYLRQVAPDLLERVEEYTGNRDAFDEFRITEQIEKALDRKVWLPSGGSLVIDRTEAMTVVDVNTGKFVGSGGNLEETVTKNNLEAAEEIVRQLRLRDIGGIIVVDFIDMVLETNRDLVLRRLIECLSRDRTKHQVAEVTSLGLVQMTRKKVGLGLLETFSEPCEVCAGRGIIVHHDPVNKHRQSAQPPIERRRGKGGQSNGNGGGAQQPPVSATTHAITDDAKNALAQIAASTIAAHAAHPETAHIGTGHDSSADAAGGRARHTAEAEAAGTKQEGAGQPRQGRTGQRRAGRGTTSAPIEPIAPIESAAPIESVEILDIPVTAPKSRQRVKSKDADQLLDSVLEALPQPKQPGQGRSRNRRVTTAGLTGIAVTPETTPRDQSE